MLQEFAHDADLVEIGFACTGDGATEFVRVVQRLAPLIDGDRLPIGRNADQHAFWHEERVADKRESR